ncbi:TetR/AcrR family transcriptional regulator [Bradyrhizobium sp. STM 3557]|uniref:TetR/AcrR family transcriptional regulator n=1 Tax=Bradyrhizobium sp. STM 3557 TaxID=578920 RepID=UPI0038904B53
MSKASPSCRTGSSSVHKRIVQVAIRLYREIGHRKTTVADIARGASMSAANIYRFYPSRRAVEEAAVAELLEEVSTAAERGARCGKSGLERLHATFIAISRSHEDRLTNDARLHDLVVASSRANWPVVRSHPDRLRALVWSIILRAQGSGEFRPGNPMMLACCLLDAMNAYVNPSRIEALALGPTFDEMMSFCAGALGSEARCTASMQMTGARLELQHNSTGRS